MSSSSPYFFFLWVLKTSSSTFPFPSRYHCHFPGQRLTGKEFRIEIHQFILKGEWLTALPFSRSISILKKECRPGQCWTNNLRHSEALLVWGRGYLQGDQPSEFTGDWEDSQHTGLSTLKPGRVGPPTFLTDTPSTDEASRTWVTCKGKDLLLCGLALTPAAESARDISTTSFPHHLHLQVPPHSLEYISVINSLK